MQRINVKMDGNHHIDEDLLEVFLGIKKLVKSHNALLQKCQEQQEGITNLNKVLKIATDSSEKQNELQKQSDRIAAHQQNIIDNLMSVKVENKLLKEQIKVHDDKMLSKQKEFDSEREELKEQLREMGEMNEEKINKIKKECYEDECRLRSELTEKERAWENTRKELEEAVNEQRSNVVALKAEKDEYEEQLKSLRDALENAKYETAGLEKRIEEKTNVSEKYEEQLKSLRDALENAKYETRVLEKRNEEKINFYEKKMEDLEKHYISMMEAVKKDMKPMNLTNDSSARGMAGSSKFQHNLNTNPHQNLDLNQQTNLNSNMHKLDSNPHQNLNLNQQTNVQHNLDSNLQHNLNSSGTKIGEHQSYVSKGMLEHDLRFKINLNVKELASSDYRNPSGSYSSVYLADATNSTVQNRSGWQQSLMNLPKPQYYQQNQAKSSATVNSNDRKGMVPLQPSIPQLCSDENGNLGKQIQVTGKEVKTITSVQSFPSHSSKSSVGDGPQYGAVGQSIISGNLNCLKKTVPLYSVNAPKVEGSDMEDLLFPTKKRKVAFCDKIPEGK